MTPRQKALAALATAAAAASIAGVFATGTVPDAPQGQQTCVVSWAVGPCEAALALSDGEVMCEPGAEVTLPVEQVLVDGAGGGPEASLPEGFIGVDGTTREVPCGQLRRAGKALTVVPLEKHGTRLGTRIDTDGTVIPGLGPFCPPVVIAGHEPPECK